MLNPEELIGGLFSLIYVVSNTITGTLILLRYFKYKEKTFIYAGVSSLGIACPWWPSSISFLSHVIFSYLIPDQLYFFLGNAFAPLMTFFWILAMNILLFEGKNKKFVFAYAIIFSIFEIAFLIVLFIAPGLIGVLDANHLNVDYFGFVMVLLILIVITILVTGIMFSLKSLKSDNPVIKLKGRIFFICFILWAVLATLDSSFPLDIIGVVIVRILLVISSIFFYFAWVMPEPAQKFFTKIKLLKPE